MIKVIASDLDGTLFYPKKLFTMIPKNNRELIEKFHRDGNRFVLVSSRSLQFAQKVQKKLGFPIDFIGSDGSFIMIDGKLVKEAFFDPVALKSLMKELREKYDPGLMIITSKTQPMIITRTFTHKFSNFGYFLYEMSQGVYREPFRRSDHLFFQEVNKGEIQKLMILIGLSKQRQMLAKYICDDLTKQYPQFEFVWLNQFIEITPKGCNKASGVAFYLDYLGLDKDNVAVVGDSGNDVPMFQAFHENSYCMDHAPEPVKSQAAHVVKRVSDLQGLLCPSADSK